MKSSHTFIPTVSTILILTLVVQAIPLLTSNNFQLVPGDIQADPHTAIHDHAIRSYNPFDLPGIFARADHVKKEEPRLEDESALANIPPAPSTSTVLLDVVAEIEAKKEEVRDLEPYRSTPTTLSHLKEMAEEAIRDRQTLIFFEIQHKLTSYYLDKFLPGNIRVPNDGRISPHVRNLAYVLNSYLSDEKHLWDEKDIVDVTEMKQRRNTLRPNLMYWSDDSQWNPVHDLGRLSGALRAYLDSNIDSMYRLQRILDLGYAFINKATIHHRNVAQGYEDMFIVGYQLMTVTAMLALDIFSERAQFRWILYLIRDAEHAEGNSDKVQKCLKQFARGLDELVTTYHIGSVQKESNWKPTTKRDGTQKPSKRQQELEKRAEDLAAKRADLEAQARALPSGSGGGQGP